ncbi:MAG: hypothetical protein UH241_04430 [Acutalibacteraceae bacterium]|nr:hypothetical protein [Acutalibacteraceae bacterium]
MDIFNQIWEWLSNLLTDTLQWIIDLLPDSPFTAIDFSAISPYLGYINYFIPIDFMLSTFLLWLSAIAVYYCYSCVLRWLKVIN